MIETLVKNPDEVRLYAIDFADFPEIVAGETLSGTPAVSIYNGGSALTVGSPTISGTQVRFLLSAGTLGTTYTLKCTVGTSGSHTLESFVNLQVALTT